MILWPQGDRHVPRSQGSPALGFFETAGVACAESAARAGTPENRAVMMVRMRIAFMELF